MLLISSFNSMWLEEIFGMLSLYPFKILLVLFYNIACDLSWRMFLVCLRGMYSSRVMPVVEMCELVSLFLASSLHNLAKADLQ